MTSERPAGALQICASRLSLIRRGCLQRRNTLPKRRRPSNPVASGCVKSWAVAPDRSWSPAEIVVQPKQNKYGVAQKTRRNINSREIRSKISTKTSVYKTPLKCSDSICGSYLVGVPYLVQCEEVQLLEHLNIASTRIHKPTMALKINKSTTIINTS